MTIGWRGKTVQHVDGRIGKIVGESVGFNHVLLKIQTELQQEEFVQLNSDNRDSGALGWRWLCENFNGAPHYLPLGDHNRDLTVMPAATDPVVAS